MISAILFILVIQLISKVEVQFTRVKPSLPYKVFTKYQFGQISAVEVDDVGDVYVFHRGSNTWLPNSFDNQNKYKQAGVGNIKQATIVVFGSNGNLITETGRNLFLMPHGLTVDKEKNVWITDVALHQVLKFSPIDKSKKEIGLGEPLLSLGEKLVPGSDTKHFCKPTSVAIDDHSNDFFVADGYCNSRIIKFDQSGNYILSWGKPTYLQSFDAIGPYNLNVPHSLSVNQRDKQLILADRENSRVVIYSFDGIVVKGISVRKRVYAVTYSPVTENLYGVTGVTYAEPGIGFIFSMKFGNRTSDFAPGNNFTNAHDIAISPDAKHIYVVELEPYTIWEFTVGPSEKAPPYMGALQEEVKSVVPVDEEEMTEEDALPGLGANQLAITIVTVIVLLAIFAIGCHMYRKRGKQTPSALYSALLKTDYN